MKLSFIHAACAAEWGFGAPSGDPELTGVTTDSRKVGPGELFAALAGPNFDGHDFIDAAIHQGCAALLVSRLPASPPSVPVLRVPDVLTALGQAGTAWRRQVAPLVIGVTGSSGKTTVKEMIAACLRAECAPVHATTGNLNNHIGVPLTLLAMPADCRVAVIEMGMSAAGEISFLADLARPSIGVVTNVQPAHMASFSDLGAVAAAKGELLAALPADGWGLIPALEPQRPILEQAATHCRRIRFGPTPNADIRWEDDPTPGDGARRGTILWPDGTSAAVDLGVCAPHRVVNTLAAAGVARLAGASPEAIGAALTAFQPLPGRGAVLAGPEGWTILDDTYNANPGSMAAAIASLGSHPARRRVAILGDMLELGAESPTLHAALTRDIAKNRIDLVLTAGSQMRALHEALRRDLPGIDARHQDDPSNWLKNLSTQLRRDDVILVKGSRGMRMERLVKDLMNHAV
ncbi:UDP-N-acetylmuramoyl-tripeptide--D-alanyl-D-alanine ligase [Candidatus Magnetaquicoccaceae bacterium FCR-1]|uniref:UDP-N-acetylmuramoyl-tripeptide--D-alanyl-D-alanine ligase n=1 Tax=Candidatus Magnetaquiglobus chichijimensis TaxID=3141448 RepID=A0ABQ0CBL5_9PROT